MSEARRRRRRKESTNAIRTLQWAIVNFDQKHFNFDFVSKNYDPAEEDLDKDGHKLFTDLRETSLPVVIDQYKKQEKIDEA